MDNERSQLEAIFQMPPVEVNESECLFCAGSGRCACSWCKGSGVRMETEMKSNEALKEDIERMMRGEPIQMPGQVPVQCSACKGSTSLPCKYCKGCGKGMYGYSSSHQP